MNRDSDFRGGSIIKGREPMASQGALSASTDRIQPRDSGASNSVRDMEGLAKMACINAERLEALEAKLLGSGTAVRDDSGQTQGPQSYGGFMGQIEAASRVIATAQGRADRAMTNLERFLG